MKKIFGLFLIGALVVSCGKENEFSNDFASVALINASPLRDAGNTLVGVTIAVDTMPQVLAPLSFRSSSGYLSVKPGDRRIDITSIANLNTRMHITNRIENFQTNTASTLVLYDTVSTGDMNLKMVRLRDDLSLPANGQIKVRFLHLAPRTNPLDVTFVRTSVTPNDSVTITNRSFIGMAPSAAELTGLSAFSTILPTGAYTVRLKNAGTAWPALLSGAYNLPGATGVTGIYTFWAAGSAQGQPLTINAMSNYR